MATKAGQNKIYEMVTSKFIKLLDEGIVPWRARWNTIPTSAAGHQYRGINHIWLGYLQESREYTCNRWYTFKRAGELDGRIKKGEHATDVLLWKWYRITDKDPDTEEEIVKRFPTVRYYQVFNGNQIDWQGEYKPPSTTNSELEPIPAAEKIISDWQDKPEIKHGGGSAYYQPREDIISMPPFESFETAEAYYSVLFHESGHSTGHQSRLNREEVVKTKGFGVSDSYSLEELVAEFTATFLCAITGIDTQDNTEQSAAYLKGWKEVLKADNRLVTRAASRAQRAADYIQNIKPEDWEDDEG